MKVMTKWAMAVMCLGLAAGLGSCASKKEENQGAEQTEEQALRLVEVTYPTEQEYNRQYNYNGTTFASREANLGAVLPGRVEKILYDVGDHVPEGALVVQLSAELLIQTKIEYETLKKDYERVKRLEEKGSISTMKYDHVRAQYQASEARMRMVESSTQITAPFAGTLAERMMEEGEVFFINPGLKLGYSMRSGIVRLMQLDPMVVRMEVNERELEHIARGMSAVVSFSARDETEYAGKVVQVKPMLSAVTHNATVEVQFANPKHSILPGMYANVRLVMPKQRGISIPIQCIVKEISDDRDFVYLVSDEGIVSRHQVQLVQTQGDRAIITGIPAKSRVLVEGKGKCKPGQKVRYVTAKQAEAELKADEN